MTDFYAALPAIIFAVWLLAIVMWSRGGYGVHVSIPFVVALVFWGYHAWPEMLMPYPVTGLISVILVTFITMLSIRFLWVLQRFTRVVYRYWKRWDGKFPEANDAIALTLEFRTKKASQILLLVPPKKK